MSEEQRVDTSLQAIEAAAVVPDPRLRAPWSRLRDRDASLKVREAARAALDGGRPRRRLLTSAFRRRLLSPSSWVAGPSRTGRALRLDEERHDLGMGLADARLHGGHMSSTWRAVRSSRKSTLMPATTWRGRHAREEAVRALDAGLLAHDGADAS
jgi:hypothetical protein